jgi:hypothetical protein
MRQAAGSRPASERRRTEPGRAECHAKLVKRAEGGAPLLMCRNHAAIITRTRALPLIALIEERSQLNVFATRGGDLRA